MSTTSKQPSEKPKLRKSVVFGIIIVLVIIIVGSGAYFFLRTPSIAKIVHSTKGDIISIGMKKDDVEDIIGEPWLDDMYSIYSDGLSLSYDRGELVRASWDQVLSGWETDAGIGIGDSMDDVFNTYGEEYIMTADELKAEIAKEDPNSPVIEHLDSYASSVVYYFNAAGKRVDLLDAVYSMHVNFDADNKVVSISISKD